MNAKFNTEIEKRTKKIAEPTNAQKRNLEERIKLHKEKYGTLDHQGLIQRLTKLFL